MRRSRSPRHQRHVQKSDDDSFSYSLSCSLVKDLRHNEKLVSVMHPVTGLVSFEDLRRTLPSKYASTSISQFRAAVKCSGDGRDGGERLVIDGSHIGARNAHTLHGMTGTSSVVTDLPPVLSHWTRHSKLRSIKKYGIVPMTRAVHLLAPGGRKPSGVDCSVQVDTQAAQRAGIIFRQYSISAYTVWKKDGHWASLSPSFFRSFFHSRPTCSRPPWKSSSSMACADSDRAEHLSLPSTAVLPVRCPRDLSSSIPKECLVNISSSDDERSVSDSAGSISECKRDLAFAKFCAEVLAEEECQIENLSECLETGYSINLDTVPNLSLAEQTYSWQWRQIHGFEDDSDFASAFASEQKALDAGGHALLLEWAASRRTPMTVTSTGCDGHSSLSSASMSSSQSSASASTAICASAGHSARTCNKRQIVQRFMVLVSMFPQHPWRVAASQAGLTNKKFKLFLKQREKFLMRFELGTLRTAFLALSRLLGHAGRVDGNIHKNFFMVESYLSSLKEPRPCWLAFVWLERYLKFDLRMANIPEP